MVWSRARTVRRTLKHVSIGLLLAFSLTAAQCPPPVIMDELPSDDDPHLVNRTDVPVVIFRVGENETIRLFRGLLPPGEERWTTLAEVIDFTADPPTSCDAVLLVAETEDGKEVDRRRGLCTEETWVIDRQSSPAKSPDPTPSG